MVSLKLNLLTPSLWLTPSLQGPEVPDVGHAGGDLSRVRHQVPPRTTLLQSYSTVTGTKPAVPRKQKYIQSEKEKALYEEDMFTRLPVTKADKLARYWVT